VTPADSQTHPSPGRPVHLASQSPRRRQLLGEAGIPHHAEHPGFDDADLKPGAVTAPQWVAALAYLKAAAGVAHTEPTTTVLGADTAIIKGEALIGTPRDRAEAHAILRTLSDGQHDVVTGVALIDPASGRRTFFVDRATVRVGHLSDCMLAAYLATEAWHGKAGGYNLRERLADGWPLSYTGDPTTVMGLPMRALVPRLEQFVAACESNPEENPLETKVPA
jgi:septum formation protein